MKADEVMIGDIVSLNGKAMHVTLAMLNTWNDNIQPIPLTKDILHANYRLDYYGVATLVKVGDVYYEVLNNMILLRNRNNFYNEDEGQFGEIVCHCEYVHEFQHALKVLGFNSDIRVEEEQL